MNIVEMHYYFNEQLKTADNEQYQELLVPQIDFLFNVAEETLIKMIAFPLYNPVPNFELTNRVKTIIQPLVVNSNVEDQNVSRYDETSYLYTLPENCFIFLGGTASANNGSCRKDIELFPMTHETVTTKDFTIKSSFLWEECNYWHIDKGIKLEAPDFIISGVKPNYIRKSKYMHNAAGYNSTYKSLATGEILTGVQNSELSESSRLDIVNLAVLLAKSNFNSSLDSQLAKVRDIN